MTVKAAIPTSKTVTRLMRASFGGPLGPFGRSPPYVFSVSPRCRPPSIWYRLYRPRRNTPSCAGSFALSLPVFTRGLARLPNYARLIRELRLLERRTHRSGKDTVEHPRNGHDDHANVVCGVLSLLAPPAFEQPNELTSPIIVSGGPITHLWGGRSGIIEW